MRIIKNPFHVNLTWVCKNIKITILMIFMCLYASQASAQSQITLNGKVMDESGDPIPGVNIVLVGGTRGVTTDIDGTFSIKVLPTDKLSLFYLGMQDLIVNVENRKEINITMKPKASELDEVTVVAFAKQKKESVLASITTIKPSELKVPSSNLTTALAGRMAGIISYQRSGEPGKDNAQFFIRGVTTFGYKKDPLILIDNNEVTTEELSRIQTDDIASFSIMKDATATALYGSRGANGVILITTKEGAEGKAKVNIRFEESLSQPTKRLKLADPITYMQLHNESVNTRNIGSSLKPLPYSQHKIDNTIARGNPYVYPANNWQDILFKNITQNQRLNFNVAGGGKVARYYIAGGLINDNGLLKVDDINNFNNNVKLRRYLLRSNVNINITKTTEAIVRLNGAFDDYTGPIDGAEDIYKKVMRSNPVLFPAYFKPDKANIHTKHILFGNHDAGAKYINPYADMVKGYKDYSTSQMSAQFEVKQKLDFITPGLELRGLFNTNRYAYFDVSRSYAPFFYEVGSYDKPKDEYTLSLLNKGEEYLGFKEGEKRVTSTTYFESALNWSRTFNEKHTVGALLVYTMRNQLLTRPNDNLQKSLPYRNIGLAGRASYSYDSRYFLELNFGYNGSERFSKKERFGFFPSAGIGWLISNEAFWGNDLKATVSKLKLKATYGLVGNDAIGDENDRFFYLSNVNMKDPGKSSSFGTLGNFLGDRSKGYKEGVSISRYPNDNITWETAIKFNTGLEIELWKKLEIQADFFTEDRWNILMDRASIPNTMGLQSKVRSNVGEASSKGIDVSLNYNHFINDDIWLSALANFTYAASKFKVYEEPDYSASPWKSRVGYSLNQEWGYVAERLFVDEYEIWNSPQQFGNYRAGDIKYKDINNDGKIDELDKVPIGYPTSPEIVYGFGFSGGWKSIDASFFFQGLARESFWIELKNDFPKGIVGTSPFIDGQGGLLQAYADDYWSEDNRNVYALWPRLSDTYIDNNTERSTWFMRNGAFLRLKSVELGYTLPKKLVSRAKITNMRLYFSGTNLLTFSKFKLWDPEMGGNGMGYPIQKVFNLGVQLSF